MEIRECYWPWYEAFIHTNGDVKPCCYAPTPVGNLYSDGDLSSIWRGPVMQELREHINDNRLHRVCVGAPCIYVRGAMSDSDTVAPPDFAERLKSLADAGSGWGAARYGMTLLSAGKRDEAEAYLMLGVERRNPEAAYHLASLKIAKAHASELPDEIAALLESASAMHHVDAGLLYAKLLIERSRAADRLPRAKSLLEGLLSRGDGEAAFRLAQYAEAGVFGPPSASEAVRLYRLAKLRRHPAASACLERLEGSQAATIDNDS